MTPKLPSRRPHSLLLAGLSLILAGCGHSTSAPHTATPAPTRAPTPVPLPSRVALPRGSSAPFAIDGDTLAWVGTAGGLGSCVRYRLYMADLRNFRPHPVWTGPQCSPISDVRMSDVWVVWLAGESPGGTIWALDRRDGHIHVVAAQTYDPNNHPCLEQSCVPSPGLSLDGDILVWSHSTFSARGDAIASSILERTLPFGRIHTVYWSRRSCSMQVQPQIGGGRVVWVRARWQRDVPLAMSPANQCEGGLQTDIMTAGPHGRRAHLLTSDHDSYDPQTNGRMVTWATGQLFTTGCVCSGLELLDTATNQRETLAPRVSAIDLTAKLVAWLQSSPTSTRVVAFDLTTYREYPVAKAGPIGLLFLRTLGWGWHNRLIWEQDAVRNPNSARIWIGVKDVG